MSAVSGAIASGKKGGENIKTVSLDVYDQDFDDNGIKNFFWPVSYQERNEFGVTLARNYADLITEYDDDAAMLPYKLIAKYFIIEAVGVFMGDLLRVRYARAGYSPTLPERMHYWRAIFRKETPPPIPFLKHLRNEHSRQSVFAKFSLRRLKKIFKLLRFSEGKAVVNGLCVKPVTDKVLTSNIIATQRVPLIVQHASVIEEDVVFCRADRWFSEIKDDDLVQGLSKAHKDFEQKIMRAVEDVYSRGGATLETHSRIFLKNLLSEGAAMFRIHYDRLMSMPQSLPRRVWTGSTGQGRDTMLRHAVITCGGQAIGHDHGAGQGHADNPYMGMMELWACDCFVTFNENQASEIKKFAPGWLLFDKKMPDVVCVSHVPAKVEIFPEFVRKDRAVKTVLILVEPFDGDRGRIGPSSPELVLMDWHIRVISKLKSWGYNVIAKVHPDTPLAPPDFYETVLGARVEMTPFEQVMAQADVLLFDYVFTTTFKSALGTNIPMALIDFYGHPLTEKAWDLLGRRAALVNGGFDEENKRKVDWDELREAIEQAPAKNDNHDFFNFYYA